MSEFEKELNKRIDSHSVAYSVDAVEFIKYIAFWARSYEQEKLYSKFKYNLSQESLESIIRVNIESLQAKLKIARETLEKFTKYVAYNGDEWVSYEARAALKQIKEQDGAE